MSNSLHPEVKKFKSFVKDNPHILRDVKNDSKTLQDLFEEWKLFGEEDEIWDSYLDVTEDEKKESSDTKDDGSKDIDVLNMLKKMNLNDLQHHLGQFTTVIGSVQELIAQFKQQQPSQPPPPERPPSPFGFRDD